MAKPVPLLHLSDLVLRNEEPYFYAGKLEDLPPSFAEYDSSHRHSYFAIFFFQEGQGTHTIDFQTYEIESNSLFFLKPGQVHSWKFLKKPKGFALKVSSDFYSELGEKPSELRKFPFFSFGGTVPKISVQNLTVLSSDFSRLEEEFKKTSEPKLLFIITQLILLQLKKEYENFSQSFLQNGHPIETFQNLLESHFLKERSTSFYAKKLGISTGALNRFCQNDLGKSAKSVIHDRVILEIKRYLLHSEMNITQICWELGFSDNAYFSRYCKNQFGISPEQFREQKRKAQ